MNPATTVRPESPADVVSVRNVHESAFPTKAEAGLVDALRDHDKDLVSLVAEVGGSVVGHVLFSPVTISDRADGGVGLAPLAVLPEYQTRGIGQSLVRTGLEICGERGYPYVVVLGGPTYYARFGFVRASSRGFSNEYGVDEEFMVIELTEGALPAAGGSVRYAAEFGDLDA